MPYDEWTSRFAPRDIETGEPLPLECRPTGIALERRSAAHEDLSG